MKELLILLLVGLVVLTMVAPAFAYAGGSVGNDTGDGEPPGWAAGGEDGEPPGWTHVNPGQGGTDPGQ